MIGGEYPFPISGLPHDSKHGPPDDVPGTSDPQNDDRHGRRVQFFLEQERARREARRLLAIETRGPVLLPPIETLRERLARPRPTNRWCIQGWQPSGSRVILAAQFKAGKTTVVANYVKCRVDGDPWLGRDPVEPIAGTVALIDTEMNPVQHDDWYRDVNIRRDDRILPISLKGRAAALDLLNEDVRRQWADLLRSHDVKCLVLDCLRPVLDALGLDEHHEAGRFLVAFDGLLAEADIPDAVVVHHMGHAGERSRGDSRLRDWPDVEWRLLRQDDEPASPRFIVAYGRDVDVAEAQLAYDPTTRLLTIAGGGTRHDVRAAEALTAVLQALDAADGPLSVRGIQTALSEGEHSRGMVRTAIRLGVRDGVITTKPGKRGAILHSRLCHCAGPCHHRAGHSGGECADDSIGRHTRTLLDDDVGVPNPPKFDPSKAFLSTRQADSDARAIRQTGLELKC